MSASTEKKQALKGAEWLIKESSPFETFIPEDFNEEQQMVKDMCNAFLDTEVLPVIDRIDKLEPGLMPSLIAKAGDQGLLGAAVPEEYGGLGKDFITATLVNEGLGGGFSFSVGVSAHTGIGTLPILYFGTPEQKKKYIPKLASGEWKGSYGLTEPNSGSDALGAKTTAKLSADGKYYLLNGQKCWITNGGFADVYRSFAKIDGDKFSAFIVERGFEGFTQGPEEHKMGIKGSRPYNFISRTARSRLRTCWRDRKGTYHRIQHPEYRPAQALRRRRRGRQTGCHDYHRIREDARTVQNADRELWCDQTQTRGNGDPYLDGGKRALPDDKMDRRQGTRPRRRRQTIQRGGAWRGGRICH